MRNLLWSMLCIAAILTSCTEPSADVDNIVAGEDFTATITESRAELNGVAVLWNEADELTIFTKTAHNRHYRVKSLSNGNRTATIGYVSYSGNDNTPILSNYALYPYDADATLSGDIITTKINAEQVYNAEKVDLANALMVAKSTSTALQFVNATSLMRFEVSNNMPDSYTLSSIRLVSAANKLAGEVSIDLSTDCKAVVTENGQNEVTLSGINCEITAEKQSFYVALPATTFAAKDLTVTFTYAEGVEKSFQLPAFELALGSIKTINYTINDGEDFNGETPKPNANDVIHYTATAKVEAHSNFPWSFDTFGANIVSNEWDSESGKGIITFDADVTTIGKYAFEDCLSLTGITIPDSVTTIGEGAFYLCRYLTGITIPNSVTTIGEMAFTSCSSLTNITIPDSVTTIENKTFYDCESLINITIPDSVTTIGEMAFCGCSDLTSISIPDSVTTIGEEAFASCQSLTEFNGELASEDGRCLIIDGTLIAFAPTGLTSYTIPDSVTTIGKYAFKYCYSLTSITIPNSVTTIGESVFFGCSSLANVTLGDSVTTIGFAAFAGCGITSITIPDSVTTIGDRAFYNCNSLASVTIPDSVTTIGDCAFYYCDSLTSITIPNSITTIGAGAFYYCSNLTSITIPNSVTTIGNEAFDLCRSLASVYCEATTPPSLGSYAFSRNASERKFYVPAESVEVYKTADYWREYASYIVGYDFE